MAPGDGDGFGLRPPLAALLAAAAAAFLTGAALAIFAFFAIGGLSCPVQKGKGLVVRGVIARRNIWNVVFGSESRGDQTRRPLRF